jgi:outer membrane lipopolysaccharide assembly protein LptE/RlpB
MTVRTGIRPALRAGTGALAATLLLAGCGFDLDGPGPAPAPEVTIAPSDVP